MNCTHDIVAKEVECFDGACPVCLQEENRRLREALEAMCEWYDMDDGLMSKQDAERLMKARGLAEKALGGK